MSKSVVNRDSFEKLQREADKLREELESYRQRSPLVGVRWYGEGGLGIHLTHSREGISKVELDGYGAADVIDYATWHRMKKSEVVGNGLLVRDDSVIDEEKITGIKAKVDDTKSVNAFTDSEIAVLMEQPLSTLAPIIDMMDSHWGPEHFIRWAKRNDFKDVAKIQYIKKKRDFLAAKYRWSLAHPHDLQLACELHKVEFEGRYLDDVIDELTQIEIANAEPDIFE